MSGTLKMNIGPTHVDLDEVVAGSALIFSFLLEQEDPLNPCTYIPFDFTGYTVIGYVKKNVNVDPEIAQLDLTVPGVNGPGWVDVFLGGDETTLLAADGKCTYHFSIKIIPVGDPDRSTTIMVGTFPVVRRATP